MAKAYDCADSSALYDSLNWCPGTKTLPGFRPRVYFIPVADIAAWPKLPKASDDDAPAKMADLAVLKGDFTLAADKTWRFIDCDSVRNNGTSETQGETGGKTFVDTLTLVFPATDAAASALAAQLANERCAFLFQERAGKFRLVGSEAFGGATIAPSLALGEGETGQVGTTFAVTGTTEVPMPYYAGKIETEDGDISGLDGSPVAEG